MLVSCEPIYYFNFNKKTKQVNENLLKLEKNNNKIGVTCFNKNKNTFGFTTFSLIATITSILCNKRLSFILVYYE